MKKFFIIISLSLLLIFCVFMGTILNSNKTKHEDYLRIHIRANSNLEKDQDIKYLVKEAIVEYLTPVISKCETKQDFLICLEKNLLNFECISNEILAQNNFDYKTRAYINEEYFPIRDYEGFTLENGYYDALIIALGSGKGDNWWCVVYPPLCFLNSNADYSYKSRILEIIKKYFGG